MEVLSTTQLEVLYRMFFAESKKALVLEEFVSALACLLGIAEDETKRMFLKIDADNDGSVTWEEFASHILAIGQSKRNISVQAAAIKVLDENLNRGLEKVVDHAMTIEVAAYIPANQWRPDIEKYVTCTRDGVVKLWNASSGYPIKSNVTLQGPAAYVLAVAPLCKYNVVAISSNDHKIRFFSYEPRLRLDLEYDCGNCQAMAMECFAMEEKSSDRKDSKSWVWTSYLVWGDDRGCLHFVMEDCLMELRSATAAPCVDASRVQKINSERNFSKALFNGWVTRLEFFSGFSSTGILVASSNDGTVVTLSPESWQVLLKFQGHKFAIKTFAWCKQYKCIASGGLERDILMWDITTGHKTGRLRGHQAPVLHMVYFEKQDTLFSLDQRYFLHVWDVSKQSLITRINTDEGDPFVDYHGLRAGCMLVNQRRGHVTLCARRPFVWTIRPIDNADDDVGLSFHSHPLIAVLYSTALHQLVSLDHSGLVLVCEFHDGKVCFRFNIPCKGGDGKEADISCAILNIGHRELIVGFVNGRVSVYNFNNGFLVNHYITDSNAPIMALEVSEQSEKRGSMIFASGLDGCVWMWLSAVTDRPAEIMFEKKFELPPERPDFDIDVVSISYNKSGMLAAGRQDGRVLIWNPIDGRLKKDLVDDLFVTIDADHSGVLSYAEISEFLKDENYTQERIDTLFKRIDKDSSGDISREEFRSVMSKEGTLLIDPFTGRAFAKRDQQVEVLKFFHQNELLIASGCANGTMAIYNAETGAFFRFLHLTEQRRSDTLSCFSFDDKENLMVTGDSVGVIKVHDISELSNKSQPCMLLQTWKAHYEAVLMVTVVESRQVVVSCNGGQDPQIFVWRYTGELVGITGDRNSRMWAVPSTPDYSVPSKLRQAAMDKIIAMAKEAEDMKNAQSSRPGKSKAKTNRRITTFKSAAYSVLNKNFFEREASRDAELEIRVKRMKLFFKLQQHHFADSMDLIEKFEAHMKQIWRKEIEDQEIENHRILQERQRKESVAIEPLFRESKEVCKDEKESVVHIPLGNINPEPLGPTVPNKKIVPTLFPPLQPRFGPTQALTAREGSTALPVSGVAPAPNSSREYGWHNIAVQHLGQVSQDSLRQERAKVLGTKSIFARPRKDHSNSSEDHTALPANKPNSARRNRLENELDALSVRPPAAGVTTGLAGWVPSASAMRRSSIHSQISGPSPRYSPQVRIQPPSAMMTKDPTSPVPPSVSRHLPLPASEDPSLEKLSSPITRNTLQPHPPAPTLPIPIPPNRKMEIDVKPKGRVWHSKLSTFAAEGTLATSEAAKATVTADDMRVVAESRLWEWSGNSRWRLRLFTIQAGAVFSVDLDRTKAQLVRVGGFSQRTSVRVMAGQYQGRRNCLTLEMDDGSLFDSIDTRSVVLSADDEREMMRWARALDAGVDRARKEIREVEQLRLAGGATMRQAKSALERIMRIEKKS